MPIRRNPPYKIPKSFSATKTEKGRCRLSGCHQLSPFVSCKLRTRRSSAIAGSSVDVDSKERRMSRIHRERPRSSSFLLLFFFTILSVFPVHLVLGGCLCLRVSTNTWPPAETMFSKDTEYKKERMDQRQGSHVFAMNHVRKTAWRTFAPISSTREPGCLCCN